MIIVMMMAVKHAMVAMVENHLHWYIMIIMMITILMAIILMMMMMMIMVVMMMMLIVMMVLLSLSLARKCCHFHPYSHPISTHLDHLLDDHDVDHDGHDHEEGEEDDKWHATNSQT